MKINLERWCAIAFIGCLAIGTAILPADRGKPLIDWLNTPERTRVQLWQSRSYARQNHEAGLFNAYAAARDLGLARELFGSTPAKVGDPDVRFASDVSPVMRAEFTKALDDERSARPEWKGHGKVGVIVRLDTVTRVNGVKVPRLEQRYERTSSRVIMPSAATGGRCVVVIELPDNDPWNRNGTTTRDRPSGPMHPILDACGYYDAFGTPGAAVESDLSADRFYYARGYAWVAAPRDTVKHPVHYGFQRWTVDAREIRCLAGTDTSCVAMLHGNGSEDYYWWYSRVAFASGVTSARQLFWELPRPNDLNRMVLDVGPQRFSRIWTSPKSFDEAYRDETGQTLGAFVRHSMEHELGTYKPGPWTSWLTNMLTLLGIAAMLGITTQFSRRPRVA